MLGFVTPYANLGEVNSWGWELKETEDRGEGFCFIRDRHDRFGDKRESHAWGSSLA